MTGKEVLAQVREALRLLYGYERVAGSKMYPQRFRAAIAALDGCVLLTREEADDLRRHIETSAYTTAQVDAALALLTEEKP